MLKTIYSLGFVFAVLAASAQDANRLTFHQPPKPLSPDAKTSDWPRFLGPNDDCTSPETHLIDSFPEVGPAPVWELKKGSGYTSPVFSDGKMVMFEI